MISLYQTYTVSIQSATAPYAPDNDLELQLFEGKIEIKPNVLNSGKKDIFEYGTTNLAIPVYDKNGVECTALVADSVERPGEYDFVEIDLNKANSLSYLGETLYSVVAVPNSYDPSDMYANSKIVLSSKDISDQNIKQIVRAAIGGTTSLVDNMVIAGGTVDFDQYTTSPVLNSSSRQYLKILNLPSEVTDMTETATSYPANMTATKLCMRFNVYYSNGTNVIRWEGVPCHKTANNSWVIILQADQYNVYRTQAFGAMLDLSAIWQNFIITVDPTNNNVHFRRFDTNPTIALPTTGSTFERTVYHSHIDGTEPIAGIGAWTYSGVSNTPSQNLDVLGSRGARIKTGSYIKLSITSSDSTIGYDTTQSYFKSTPDSTSIMVQGLFKFSGTNSLLLLGHSVAIYPRLNMTSTVAKIESASNTYISVNTSNQIYGYVSGNQALLLDAGQSTLKFAPYTFNLGASATYLSSAVGYRFYTGSAHVLVGFDIINYTAPTEPAFMGTATFARMQGTSTTYFSATSSNQLYAYQGSNQALAIEGSQTKLKFGATTAGYSFSLGSSVSYLHYDDPTGAYRLYMTGSLTAFGHNIAEAPVTPAFVGITTYARMQGNLYTYILCNSSNEIYANVYDGSSKRSIWLAAGDYRFGYYVDNANGVYYKATNSSSSLVHTNKNILNFDGTALTLGYNAAAEPKIILSASSISISASTLGVANRIFLMGTAAAMYQVYLFDVPRIHIDSYRSYVYYDSNTYLTVESKRINLQPGALHPSHLYTDTYVGQSTGAITGVGYLKIPFTTVDPPPAATYPEGALIMCGYGGASARLYFKDSSGSSGWKSANFS